MRKEGKGKKGGIQMGKGKGEKGIESRKEWLGNVFPPTSKVYILAIN